MSEIVIDGVTYIPKPENPYLFAWEQYKDTWRTKFGAIKDPAESIAKLELLEAFFGDVEEGEINDTPETLRDRSEFLWPETLVDDVEFVPATITIEGLFNKWAGSYEKTSTGWVVAWG